MQVIEPKHFNIKSQGFMAVFFTKSVELTESCLKKQELTLRKGKKLKKAFTLQKTDWQHIIKYSWPQIPALLTMDDFRQVI